MPLGAVGKVVALVVAVIVGRRRGEPVGDRLVEYGHGFENGVGGPVVDAEEASERSVRAQQEERTPKTVTVGPPPPPHTESVRRTANY